MLQLLQGNWNDGLTYPTKFEIKGNHPTTTNTEKVPHEFYIELDPFCNQWLFSSLTLLFTNTYIHQISTNTFTIYDYENTVVKIDTINGGLINHVRIYEFNRTQ